VELEKNVDTIAVTKKQAILLLVLQHIDRHYCASAHAFVWCLSVWRLSVAYIGPNSRTERRRKTKIGTEVDLVTRDSDTTFKVKRSKVNLVLMS